MEFIKNQTSEISLPHSGRQVIIHPSFLSGEIYAPASKSSMQRACAAALLRKGITNIHNPGISNDDHAALNIIKCLGANVINDGLKIIVESKGVIPNLSDEGVGNINCGESGLSIRMFAPIVALSNHPVLINGKGSLAGRPMDFFDEVLPHLGVTISSNGGKLPLKVQGPLKPENIEIDGSLSSQFLTGLLMAYAAADTSFTKNYNGDGLSAETVSITVHNLKSKPYIDLTLHVMKAFGLTVPENKNYESFVFHRSEVNHSMTILDYTVEGDWSGAAFLLVAGAIAGNITVKGLDVFSSQADKKILEALQDSGSSLSISENEIRVNGKNNTGGLKAFHFNATDCPDLFPPLVALAACCEGTSVIEGVSRLAHKESNRGLTLQEEFAKMGVVVILQDNLMLVEGTKFVKGAKVHSRHDHRIAMACAVAALVAEGVTSIEEADAINKSYPNFYQHLEKLGALVS